MKTLEFKKQKRYELKEISNTLREAKEKGEIKTINEGLKQIYSLQGYSNLKTFEQWKREGKQVKKNEKAIYLWRRQSTFIINENGERKEITYFPLLAVFSEQQVYNLKTK